MDLPLPTLLSQVFVAYVIELDNESEHRMKHRTSLTGPPDDAPHAPWLISAAMWFNCLRFVEDEGVTVVQLLSLARMPTNLDGMRRWGYVTIEAPDGTKLKKGVSRSILRPTAAGRLARQAWPGFFPIVDAGWRERFGGPEMADLRHAMIALVGQLDPTLPDFLPILGHGWECHPLRARIEVPLPGESELRFISLLSRALLAFAMEFERDSKVSLAISANVLRVVGREEVRVSDLPRMAGISKEAIAMAVGFLRRRGLATVQSSGVKTVRLTEDGLAAHAAYVRRIVDVEADWRVRYGPAVGELRSCLEPIVAGSALPTGIRPYPDGWRAKVPPPQTLPHFPTILHRGGYPDGA